MPAADRRDGGRIYRGRNDGRGGAAAVAEIPGVDPDREHVPAAEPGGTDRGEQRGHHGHGSRRWPSVPTATGIEPAGGQRRHIQVG